MNVLPEDVITYIYEKKHKLEMNDVHDDIIMKFEDKVNDAISLIMYFNKNIFLGENRFPLLWVALRNEGVITDHELTYELNKLHEHLIICHEYLNMDFSFAEYTKNYDVTIQSLIKKYKEYINDARRHMLDIQHWEELNVV